VGKLSDEIRAAVRDGRYLVAEFDQAKLVRERPRSKPNPSIVVRQTLIDGTEAEVIWSWLPQSRRAKLVTVYFRD
jgi:hypothetical protein